MKTSNLRRGLLALALPAAFVGGLAVEHAQADQPYMHTALDQLGAARATLQAGAADKGGHRLRAIALIDRAMNEVRAGIQFAR